MSTDSESAVAAADALRLLALDLRHVGAAASAVEWRDATTLASLAAQARADLNAARHEPLADPVLAAVDKARAAVAEAVLLASDTHGGAVPEDVRTPIRRAAMTRVAEPIPALGHRVVNELRHILADKPRAILLRVLITLAISMSLVTFYHLIGWASYDNLAQLVLYLFSAVVGSVVCTNALCFEAARVQQALSSGQRLWQVMVAKNVAMALLITVAGIPVITFLTFTADVNPVAMVDQLLTMVFIWLGVGNVLSVVYPLRHEPISARIHDGTWQPFLFSFAISYGVGLTVNLMIYWRLWARQTAATELAGGVWAAFILVLVSSMVSWVLLTVFAVACSRDPQIRRLLTRELVVYRKKQAADRD